MRNEKNPLASRRFHKRVASIISSHLKAPVKRAQILKEEKLSLPMRRGIDQHLIALFDGLSNDASLIVPIIISSNKSNNGKSGWFSVCILKRGLSQCKPHRKVHDTTGIWAGDITAKSEEGVGQEHWSGNQLTVQLWPQQIIYSMRDSVSTSLTCEAWTHVLRCLCHFQCSICLWCWKLTKIQRSSSCP